MSQKVKKSGKSKSKTSKEIKQDEFEENGEWVSDENALNEVTVDSLLENFTLCPCCQNEYNQPKILPCLHSFCYECLESNLQQSGVGPGEAFLCPICRTHCTVPARGVRAMKSNIFLVTLQEFGRSKTLDPDTECDACDVGRPARKKCIECTDWLCNQCCSMHLKVKMTKDHHLVSAADLESGKFDQLIKESFEPLICNMHEEPLKLFCCEPGCQAPICTVCKNTPAHDSHQAVELTEQANKEAAHIRNLIPWTKRFISSTAEKISNLEVEENNTLKLRKDLHEAINNRTQEVVERVVRRIQRYAENMLAKIEELSKEHRKQVLEETELCRDQLQAAVSARSFSEALLSFDRPEELVSMSKEVKARLEDFQNSVDPTPPAWKEPRLNPPSALEMEELDPGEDRLMAKLFGELTFEGEAMTRSLPVAAREFSARWTHDDREPALCDVTLDGEGNIIVVDKENRRVKIFDPDGALRVMSDEDADLKVPNRVMYSHILGQIIVKDEKSLKLFNLEGHQTGVFTQKLKQPVGLAQNSLREILVTDWMHGEVVCLDEQGFKTRSFPIMCEAPGYLTCCPNGNIVVTDWKQHVVKIFSQKGKLLKQFGERGGADGQLDHPYGVCSDKYNNIIVCDTWNHRIVLLSEEGRFIKTIVGKVDGIDWPQSVAVDEWGRLIVVEQHGLVKFFKYLA